jgi:DNA ligase (NAD+)
MYFRLVRLEQETKEYYEDSPTQRINYQVVNKLNKIEHNHPMLSLDKTKSINEIKSFIGNKDYIAMAKMDGLTCSLRYLDGKLVSAETRGNGLIGEDILHNALVVKSIPNKIDYKKELIIDGEIICTYKDFEYFKDEYKNPRNFASGSIRLLDSKECAMRNLTFVVWDVIKGFEEETTSFDKLVNASIYGFTIVPLDKLHNNNIEEQIDFIQSTSKACSYPIDGLVFKYNNCDEYAAAGKTDHHFKGAIAYKFYDEEYETTLLDIEWTMGRTGILTPVAILEPVNIDGTEISRANLHNISIMKELGVIYYGSKVNIFKANQIIPQISEVTKNGTDIIVYPTTCPICGGETSIHKDNNSEVLYCDNPQCQGKLINQISHFWGKKGLDAKGISNATIEKLIEWGWVNSISDMFTLSKYAEEWKKMSGFGQKSVSNIIGSIKASCNCSLEGLISAAGIPLIGRAVAKDLSKYFKTYSDFRQATKSFDFSKLDGFGYEMNKSLKEFDYTELDYIVENYLTIEQQIQQENENNSLNDIIFVVTGKLIKFKNRNELKNQIESLGGKVTESVSKNTNYLINNDSTSNSAKNNKAKELNIPIITEEEFIEKFLTK